MLHQLQYYLWNSYFQLNQSFGSGRLGAVFESFGFFIFCAALSFYWSELQKIDQISYLVRLIFLLGYWRAVLFFIIRLSNTLETDNGIIKNSVFDPVGHIIVICLTSIFRLLLCWLWLIPFLVFELNQSNMYINFIDIIFVVINLITLLLFAPAIMCFSGVFPVVRACINTFLPMLLLICPIIWLPSSNMSSYLIELNPISVFIINLENSLLESNYDYKVALMSYTLLSISILSIIVVKKRNILSKFLKSA
tara:strand:+ start:12974 stop:13726 length:753 start_codon:yes stop_codon:yes gene_type:complete